MRYCILIGWTSINGFPSTSINSFFNDKSAFIRYSSSWITITIIRFKGYKVWTNCLVRATFQDVTWWLNHVCSTRFTIFSIFALFLLRNRESFCYRKINQVRCLNIHPSIVCTQACDSVSMRIYIPWTRYAVGFCDGITTIICDIIWAIHNFCRCCNCRKYRNVSVCVRCDRLHIVWQLECHILGRCNIVVHFCQFIRQRTTTNYNIITTDDYFFGIHINLEDDISIAISDSQCACVNIISIDTMCVQNFCYQIACQKKTVRICFTTIIGHTNSFCCKFDDILRFCECRFIMQVSYDTSVFLRYRSFVQARRSF